MATIALIFLITVGCLFCYIFFAPFYLELDSTRSLYRLRFHHLAWVRFKMIDDSLFMQFKILGWTKQLDILKEGRKVEQKKSSAIQKTKKIKRAPATIPWKRIRNVLASFRINRCQISIDLGDVQANAFVYPLAYWISVKSKKNIAINFIGKNELVFEIQNSLARMSWAYISSSTNS